MYLNIKTDIVDSKENRKGKILDKILSFFIPIANPDFEDKIFLVSNWLLEFDNESAIPNREIGLNSESEVILKMPYKKNYGYWIDNSLTYNDFKKKFDYEVIDKEVFEKNWVKID
ncbi:hypothetical protein [Galbibacter sp.]|uniref:hypothetical protein n=1 Tax=Galbibacter sp. TaxID=2918471 RepID=UPI003A8E15B7